MEIELDSAVYGRFIAEGELSFYLEDVLDFPLSPQHSKVSTDSSINNHSNQLTRISQKQPSQWNKLYGSLTFLSTKNNRFSAMLIITTEGAKTIATQTEKVESLHPISGAIGIPNNYMMNIDDKAKLKLELRIHPKSTKLQNLAEIP